MLVGRGALTLRTYTVEGRNTTPKSDRILEKLDAFAFTGLGHGDEVSLGGWVGPDHLFDGDFNIDKCFRGPFAVFAMRLDTRKVNGPLLQASLAMEIEATKEAEGLERLSAARKLSLIHI